MKKTTNSVFARILSLALVMALMLMSIMSSLVFTASAEEAEYYKEVIDFEDGALPSDAVLGDKFTVTAPVAENGNYSLYRSYASGGMAYVDFYNFDMTAGTTYIIQYDYYIVPAADGETYSTWHNLNAFYESGNTKEILSTSPSMYGEWYTKSATFTPTENVSHIRLNANYSNIYFDNITVTEYKNYAESFGSYYEVDFSDYDKALETPLFSKTSASIEYDEELGKNVYAVNVSSGAGNLTFVPVYTKANTKYSVEITYKVTAWCCAVVNGNYDGGIPLDSTSGYVTKNYSFTNNSDGALFGFGSTAGSRTLYISSIKVAEIFDTTVGTAENGTATVSATEAPANTTVTYTAVASSGYVFDYWADAQGNKVSESVSYVHTVTADTILTPVFAKNANSSAYQSYDFDKISPELIAPAATEYTTDKDGNVTNALKITTKTSGNLENPIKLAFELENGKSYKLSYSYKGTGKVMPYVSIAGDLWNSRLMLETPNQISFSSDVWTTRSAVFTADKAINALNFCSIADADYAGTLYIDNIVIEEVTLIVNTAEKQTYDFDLSNPTISGNSALETVTGNDGNYTNALKVTGISTNNNYHMITLDYPLEAGKRYKVSYDYKGSAHVRLYAYTSSNTNTGWDTRKNTEEIGGTDTAYYFISDKWERHEAVFTAENEYGWISFWVPSWELIDSTNGDLVYFDNIVIEEYTATESYEEDFEDGTTFDGAGLKTKPISSIVTDPLNTSNYSLKLSASSYTAYHIAMPRLVSGHTYIISMDTYNPSANSFRIDICNSNASYAIEAYTWITTPTDNWKKSVITYTATANDQFISLFIRDQVHIDNFKLIDITNKLNNTENYSEDFSNTDDTTFIQSGFSSIEYITDEELGKNVAVVTFNGTSAGNYGWVKVPYYMQNGVEYRVKMTYKSTAWVAPYINGGIDGNQGAGATDEWINGYWYITGKNDTDYFAFGTNASTATVQIASIEIEKLTLIEGDINNDGEVLANDLVLLTKYLLDVKDEEIFAGKKNDTTVYSTGNADIKEDGVVNILDFIRLKKTVSGTMTLTDDASAVNAVAYNTENVALSTTSADLLEDKSSFKVAVSGEDAYIVYKLSGGITEAAVEYDIGVNFMGDFSFEVSDNGKIWTEVTAQDISKEEINSNSWVRATEYFGGLGNASYFKINFPETVADEETVVCHVRTVQINGLTADKLYSLNGYNSLLREAQTVYVSNSGDDNNSGLSENAPLKTLSAAFDRMLVPGDRILLERGSTFEGEVKILSSGTEAAPIVVGSYGEGDKPVITNFETAIKVTGEYVEIADLAFTDADSYSAVDFYALKEGATKGVSVTNCDFYEINTVADGGSHDRSSGGVHFLAKGNKPTWFDGVTVSNNKFNRLGRNAIYVSSDWAARDTEQEWGIKNFKLEGKPVYLSENVVIEYNKIENNSGDAITVIGTDGALIQYNTVANSKLLYNVNYKRDDDTKEYVYDENGNHVLNNVAWASIWCHSSDNCVMQYNEVYGNRADNQGQDLQAFDIDLACNNCIVQYNYSHDNDGGFLLLCGEDSANNGGVNGSIVRYNLSVNDAAIGYYVIDITGSVADSQIYNNTIYCGNNTDSQVKNIKLVNLANYQKVTVKSSNTVFTNNIFYAESNVSVGYGYGDAITKPAFQNVTFNYNAFHNIATPSYENLIKVTNTVSTEPVFVNAGADAIGLSNGENYKVTNIDELVGVVIENNGGQDYFGNTVNSTLIGAIK